MSGKLLDDISLQGMFGGERGRAWSETLYLAHCACSYYALERCCRLQTHNVLVTEMLGMFKGWHS